MLHQPISKITATDKLWKVLEENSKNEKKQKLICDAISAGADLANINQSGLTPIQYAAQKNDWEAVINIAGMKKADTHDRYQYSIALAESIKQNALTATEKLLTAGASTKNIPINSEQLFPTLIDAVVCKLYLTTKMLLETKVPTFIKDSKYAPCLHAAILNYSTMDIIQLVLKYSDVNQTGTLGDTALHHAVLTDQPTLVDFLLQAGADLTIKNKNNITSLQLLVTYGAWDCLEPLIKAQKYPEEFKDLEFYQTALLTCLNNLHLHDKAFDILLSARINSPAEQIQIETFIKTSMNEIIDKFNYWEPLKLIPYVSRCARFSPLFQANFINFCFSIERKKLDKDLIDEMLCTLLAYPNLSNLNDELCKQLAIAKPEMLKRMIELSGENPQLGLMLLKAAVDPSNGLGKVIHTQQSLFKSKTVKKIYKEIEKRNKETKQKELSSLPSTSSMPMWQPPKAPSQKIGKKLKETEERMFKI